MRHAANNRRPARRRGVYAVQLLLALPLALALFLAAIEFGLVLLIEQTVGAAAQEGTRLAARGATDAEVLAAINQVLSIHQIAIAAATTDANVVVERSASAASPVSAFPCTPIGPALALSPAETRVTICLSLSAAGAQSAWQGGTLPDLLTLWGVGLMNRVYTVSALAPAE